MTFTFLQTRPQQPWRQHKHTESHKFTQTHTKTHKDSHKVTQIHKFRQAHTNSQKFTQTHTNSHRHTSSQSHRNSKSHRLTQTHTNSHKVTLPQQLEAAKSPGAFLTSRFSWKKRQFQVPAQAQASVPSPPSAPQNFWCALVFFPGLTSPTAPQPLGKKTLIIPGMRSAGGSCDNPRGFLPRVWGWH